MYLRGCYTPVMEPCSLGYLLLSITRSFPSQSLGVSFVTGGATMDSPPPLSAPLVCGTEIIYAINRQPPDRSATFTITNLFHARLTRAEFKAEEGEWDYDSEPPKVIEAQQTSRLCKLVPRGNSCK